MPQMNWDIENTIESLISRVRSKLSVLAGKLPHSVLHGALRLSTGFKIFLLIVLGFVFYEMPKGFVSAQVYPQLYGMQYIALFACVVIYGKRAALGLYLFLTFLKILLNGITFKEITGTGVPITHFADNLIWAGLNWGKFLQDIIIVTCFILLFAVFLHFLKLKIKRKAILILPLAHFLALTICSWGLTVIYTKYINLSLATVLALPSVMLIILGSLGVLFLKVLFSYGKHHGNHQNNHSGITAPLVFCIGAFALALIIPSTPPGQMFTATRTTDCVSVSADSSHTEAARRGDTLRVWGNNGNGRLDDGTTDNSHTLFHVIQGKIAGIFSP